MSTDEIRPREETALKRGQLMLQTITMPADTNPDGDIFGGWLMAQMDLAAATAARQYAKSRVVTVAVDALTFHKPVLVGDLMSCYAELNRVGRTSVTFHVQAWVSRRSDPGAEEISELVTEGNFILVAIDEEKKTRVIKT
jgi:acyl-CoA thioesterase YciA